MTEYEYPLGAVMSLGEIREAITNKSILYSVVVDTSASVIENLVPFIPVRISEVGEDYCLYFRERQTGREGDISLDWISLDWRGISGIPRRPLPGGHLFTNYWHAYAYSLKIEQAQDA
jgi:hypothetical protein